MQSVVRNLGDTGSDLENLLQAVEGSAYVVQMRQLVQNANGGLTPAQQEQAYLVAKAMPPRMRLTSTMLLSLSKPISMPSALTPLDTSITL